MIFEYKFTLWILFGLSPDKLAEHYYINGNLKSGLNFLDYVTTWNGICMMDIEDLKILQKRGINKGIKKSQLKLINLYIKHPNLAKEFYNNNISMSENIIEINIEKMDI